MKKLFLDEDIIITKHWKANQDWEIAIPGFFILSPRKKVHSLGELTDAAAIDLALTLKTIRKAMSKVLGVKDVYVFHNEDSPYGFHIWLLPYEKWMTRFGRGPGILVPVWRYAKENFSNDKKRIQETKDAADKVRKFLSKT